METKIEKRWKRFRSQEKDDQEEIDNFAFVLGLYKQNSCIPVANFFIINLPTSCMVDVKS